jgi:hypothetical protein
MVRIDQVVDCGCDDVLRPWISVDLARVPDGLLGILSQLVRLARLLLEPAVHRQFRVVVDRVGVDDAVALARLE